MTARPRVFVSYSHDSEEHKTLVRRFADFLATKVGLEVHLDQWADGARIDWSRWALRQLKAADYTIAIASPWYRRRTDGLESPHIGRGSQFEGAILRDLLTEDIEEYTARILPVVLPGRSIDDIPQFLSPYSATHYIVQRFVREDPGVEDLVRAIRRQPRYPRPSGELPPFEDGTYVRPATRAKLLLTRELTPVAKSSDLRVEAATLNGVHYGNSLTYRCSAFCNDPRGVVEYDLGRRYRRFSVTAGVLDDARDSRQIGHFEVYLDGVRQPGESAKLGSPVLIEAEVAEVLRLQLVAYRTDTTAHPMLAGARMAGGLSNGLPELAWGDPTVSV
ncbi:SEFIR domain-containing protein [Amycolatopsis pittospori]|uniref:SEFIR domain-containing protein n=1 Tax=Amycolatopsis pittospori TaxID=2749434 RepID=UPI0015F0EC74|nr:SEFIR domain-containing protein [Amycolatopsis pittospori]